MNLTKLYNGFICRVVGDSYNANLIHVLNMYKQIRKDDFPDLKESDIHVRVMQGPRHKGMIALEFKLPEGVKVPPASYYTYKNPELWDYTYN